MNKLDSRIMYALVLRHDRGFLPRAIQFFMNVWRRMLKIPKRDKIHNHVDILYYIDGVGLMLVGAVSGGFRPRLFIKELPEKKWDDVEMYVSREPLNILQLARIDETIIKYVFGSKRRNYEYFNFLSWPVYILTFGMVRLSRKSDKVMECYEAGARVYNSAGDYFQDPEYTDIFQYYNNPNLVKYDGWREELKEYFSTHIQ